MDFFIQWVWYLLAFLLGSLFAWLIATVSVKRTSDAEPAGSREIGAGS